MDDSFSNKKRSMSFEGMVDSFSNKKRSMSFEEMDDSFSNKKRSMSFEHVVQVSEKEVSKRAKSVRVAARLSLR
jgi:hypothetical protein